INIQIMKFPLLTCFAWLTLGITPPLRSQQIDAPHLASRVVEDGGTGPYKAIMTQGSLTTHTLFHPKDLSIFDDKEKLPIIAWGNGACANSPWEHVNFLSEIASHG